MVEIKSVIILVRFTAALLLWLGILLLIRNIVLSFESFNPSYFFHYFKQELLTPILSIGAGSLMRVRAKAIAVKLTKDL